MTRLSLLLISVASDSPTRALDLVAHDQLSLLSFSAKYTPDRYEV